jgi:hypothetical protein
MLISTSRKRRNGQRQLDSSVFSKKGVLKNIAIAWGCLSGLFISLELVTLSFVRDSYSQ